MNEDFWRPIAIGIMVLLTTVGMGACSALDQWGRAQIEQCGK